MHWESVTEMLDDTNAEMQDCLKEYMESTLGSPCVAIVDVDPEEMLGKPYSDQPSLAHLEPVNVATKPGDLLIWNRLRECTSKNGL